MRFRRSVALLVLLLAAGTLACPPVANRPECPTHQLNLVRGRDTAPVTFDQIGRSPTIAKIPEFHDCQRLLNGGDYGPLVAIFAAETLAVADALAGITPTLGLAVATIFNHDSRYDALGIAQYFNCLYLFADPSGGGYVARMIGWANELCPPTSVGIESGVQLRVVVSQHSAYDSVPPVARWDWGDGQQLIGIKCGDSWCTIGPTGAWAAMPAKSPPTAASADVARTFSVKGYHDQQRLAPPTGQDYDHAKAPGPGDWTQPTNILGTIVPVPQVGKITSDAFDGEWTKVATAYLEGDPAGGYAEKYGFVNTTGSDVGNQVFLCNGAVKPCAGITNEVQGSISCSRANETIAAENLAGGHSSRWYAKVKPVLGGERFFCVIRREHPEFTGATYPNTARWRWLLDDDSIWVPCIFGCCQVRGGIG